jgi:hypothetical protein
MNVQRLSAEKSSPALVIDANATAASRVAKELSDAAPRKDLKTTLRYFADALIISPSTQELVFCLSAFSLRSRPF